MAIADTAADTASTQDTAKPAAAPAAPVERVLMTVSALWLSVIGYLFIPLLAIASATGVAPGPTGARRCAIRRRSCPDCLWIPQKQAKRAVSPASLCLPTIQA